MIKVCVIGCGNLGSAIIKGLYGSNTDYNIIGCDKDIEKLEKIDKFCHDTTDDIKEATRDADIVVVAVKPGSIDNILDKLDLSSDQNLLSVVAAVSTDFIKQKTNANVVRLMPNLAAEQREMASAVSFTDKKPAKVSNFLKDLGEYVEVDEDLMDIATAVNGSGPAFVFYLIKVMKKAGMESGLSDEQAEKLVAQTFKGAAEIVLDSNKNVDELIDAVCSPGGTTIEGIEVLNNSEISQSLSSAVNAAENKSKKISREISDDLNNG